MNKMMNVRGVGIYHVNNFITHCLWHTGLIQMMLKNRPKLLLWYLTCKIQTGVLISHLSSIIGVDTQQTRAKDTTKCFTHSSTILAETLHKKRSYFNNKISKPNNRDVNNNKSKIESARLLDCTTVWCLPAEVKYAGSWFTGKIIFYLFWETVVVLT
jgi:hypothetical protein